MDEVAQLRTQLLERDLLVQRLEKELDQRDAELRRLRNEIDKFRQVVPLSQPARIKRQAISAEPPLSDDARKVPKPPQ